MLIFIIIGVVDILLAAIFFAWAIQLGRKKNRKPPIETSNENLMGFPLRKKDKSIKYLIATLAWPLGSSLVIGLIRKFSTAGWTPWFGLIFTIVLGGILFWIVLGHASVSHSG
jgi:hypothetical protein